MLDSMKAIAGKALTVTGPVEPAALGRMLMHEHMHCDIFDWERNRLITEETPPTPERQAYMMREAVPLLKRCLDYGMKAYCDVSMPPWRGWPTLYRDVSEASGVLIVRSTGFYREMEMGTYWVKKPEDRMWPKVFSATVEELADLCIREIVEGAYGTGIRAGIIKLGTSAPEMTELEAKTFRAGARAQKATGVHITTHCTKLGAETSQLSLLDREGVDLNRVVIGHTAWHLSDPVCRKTCLEWMKRGANFMPTNLGIGADGGENWRPLVEAIHAIFDAGQGDKLTLSLDHGFGSESRAFGPVSYLPPSPWTHMFTHTLPAFRKLGLTPEEEEWIMLRNPQRVVPVQ